jgi:[CysO sulfur-carrier protein]-S-L-cysteine hydrolase
MAESSQLRITRSLVDEMIAHARREAPDECWGLLAGTGNRVLGVFPCENGAEPDERPFRYRTEPKSQRQADDALGARGWQILGIYHSHTHTQPYPSPTDIGEANPFLGDIAYVLVSLRTARQPFVYRGMSREAWQQAHDYAQTRPARPEVRAFHIRDGAAHQISLRVERG